MQGAPASMADEALSLSADKKNRLKQFRGQYLDDIALRKAARALPPAHLQGGRSSLATVARRNVSSVNSSHYEWDTLLGESGIRKYGAAKEDDIVAFTTLFHEQVSQVQHVYERELQAVQERFHKLCDFTSKLTASKSGSEEMNRRQDEIAPEFVLLYRQCLHVESFALTNASLALSVLHLPRVAGRRSGQGWLGAELQQELKMLPFCDTGQVQTLMTLIIKSFAEHFCEGDDGVARYRLLRKDRHYVNWHGIFVGAWAGAAGMAVVWAFVAWNLSERFPLRNSLQPSAPKEMGLRVFKVCGLVLFTTWGLCVQLAVWRETSVNVPAIFELPETAFPETSRFILGTARVTVLYVICFVVFVQSDAAWTDMLPLLALCVLMAAILQIWHIVVLSPRLAKADGTLCSWLRALGETARDALVFISGTSEKYFLTAFVADQLTSSTKVLADMAIITCNIFVRDPGEETFMSRFRKDSEICLESKVMHSAVIPAIMCWPLWLRVGQNLARLHETGKNYPFLLNAIKYAFAHTIVIFSTLHPELASFQSRSKTNTVLFAVALVVTSLFTFSWDVFVDWGLGDRDRNGLRRVLLLAPERPVFYYVCILADFFLRFLWALQLVPILYSSEATESISFLFTSTALTAIELIRRMVWGLIRVENEMCSNTRMYRYETIDGETGNFIPLYLNTPHHLAEGNLKAWVEPDKSKHLDLATVRTESAILLLVVLCLAASAFFADFHD